MRKIYSTKRVQVQGTFNNKIQEESTIKTTNERYANKKKDTEIEKIYLLVGWLTKMLVH